MLPTMPTVAALAIDLVLFDLGGVLIDPGGVEAMRLLSGMNSDEELWQRWLTCRWVRELERGTCSPSVFASGLVDDWGLDITADAFLSQFARWPHPLLEGAAELVSATRAARPVGCLSNTNPLHWEANCGQWPLLHEFDYQFLSFELGMVKPDAEIFEAVADRLPVPRQRVLFLDDNTMNVNGAEQAGFLALRTQGVDEARRALLEFGVLNQ
jgi:HAD superfamily hydrolase (TIGR01509 family)